MRGVICVYFTGFSQPRKEANVRYWILGVLDNRDPISALRKGLKRGAAASRQVLARSALAVITAPPSSTSRQAPHPPP